MIELQIRHQGNMLYRQIVPEGNILYQTDFGMPPGTIIEVITKQPPSPPAVDKDALLATLVRVIEALIERDLLR